MSYGYCDFNCPFDKKICLKCADIIVDDQDSVNSEDDIIFNPPNESGEKCKRPFSWRLKCRRYERFLNDECTPEETVTETKREKAMEKLCYVFKQLVFENDVEKQILFDSYVLNLENMILYAKKTRQNPYEYIRTIKQELLKNKNVHKR